MFNIKRIPGEFLEKWSSNWKLKKKADVIHNKKNGQAVLRFSSIKVTVDFVNNSNLLTSLNVEKKVTDYKSDLQSLLWFSHSMLVIFWLLHWSLLCMLLYFTQFWYLLSVIFHQTNFSTKELEKNTIYSLTFVWFYLHSCTRTTMCTCNREYVAQKLNSSIQIYIKPLHNCINQFNIFRKSSTICIDLYFTSNLKKLLRP